jgi:hypothetical protein
MDTVASAGVVVSVRGAVVDVNFNGQGLPQINTALVVEWDRPEPLVLEVHSHIDPVTIRGIALQATAGLARNTRVRATGRPFRFRSAMRYWDAFSTSPALFATGGLPCHPIPPAWNTQSASRA